MLPPPCRRSDFLRVPCLCSFTVISTIPQHTKRFYEVQFPKNENSLTADQAFGDSTTYLQLTQDKAKALPQAKMVFTGDCEDDLIERAFLHFRHWNIWHGECACTSMLMFPSLTTRTASPTRFKYHHRTFWRGECASSSTISARLSPIRAPRLSTLGIVRLLHHKCWRAERASTSQD